MSRPSRAEAPSKPFQIRLSPAERRRLEEAARVNSQKLVAFCRDALVTAAEDCLEEAEPSFRSA